MIEWYHYRQPQNATRNMSYFRLELRPLLSTRDEEFLVLDGVNYLPKYDFQNETLQDYHHATFVTAGNQDSPEHTRVSMAEWAKESYRPLGIPGLLGMTQYAEAVQPVEAVPSLKPDAEQQLTGPDPQTSELLFVNDQAALAEDIKAHLKILCV